MGILRTQRILPAYTLRMRIHLLPACNLDCTLGIFAPQCICIRAHMLPSHLFRRLPHVPRVTSGSLGTRSRDPTKLQEALGRFVCLRMGLPCSALAQQTPLSPLPTCRYLGTVPRRKLLRTPLHKLNAAL